MSAILSTKQHGADTAASRFGTVFGGYATQQAIVERAQHAFDEWWSAIPASNRLRMDGFALWRSFKTGWLEMARELGQLPPDRKIGGDA